jgi:anti-anti-sigma factor
MALSIERRAAGDIVILDLKGRATIGKDADSLNEALRGELSAGTRKLLVNLTGLVQVDSSGLANLVRTFVSMQRRGGVMLLVVPPGRVREVFDVLQLSRAITCYADEASAVASFR